MLTLVVLARLVLIHLAGFRCLRRSGCLVSRRGLANNLALHAARRAANQLVKTHGPAGLGAEGSGRRGRWPSSLARAGCIGYVLVNIISALQLGSRSATIKTLPIKVVVVTCGGARCEGGGGVQGRTSCSSMFGMESLIG